MKGRWFWGLAGLGLLLSQVGSAWDVVEEFFYLSGPEERRVVTEADGELVLDYYASGFYYFVREEDEAADSPYPTVQERIDWQVEGAAETEVVSFGHLRVTLHAAETDPLKVTATYHVTPGFSDSKTMTTLIPTVTPEPPIGVSRTGKPPAVVPQWTDCGLGMTIWLSAEDVEDLDTVHHADGSMEFREDVLHADWSADGGRFSFDTEDQCGKYVLWTAAPGTIHDDHVTVRVVLRDLGRLPEGTLGNAMDGGELVLETRVEVPQLEFVEMGEGGDAGPGGFEPEGDSSLFVLFANDSARTIDSGRPSYADLADGRNLTPLRLRLRHGALSTENMRVSFSFMKSETAYPPPSTQRQVTNAKHLPALRMTGGEEEPYYDFRGYQRTPLRIWSRLENRNTVRNAADIMDGGHYVTPQKTYMADSLFTDGECVLWLEGIKRDSIVLEATLEMMEDGHGRRLTETLLPVEILSGDIELNVTQATPYNLHQGGYVIEDQGDGFLCWAGYDPSWRRSVVDLENLFPLDIQADDKRLALIWGEDVALYVKAPPCVRLFRRAKGDSTLDYMWKPTMAEAQLALCKKDDCVKRVGDGYEIWRDEAGNYPADMVFGVLPGCGTERFLLEFGIVHPDSGQKIPLDSCLVTALDIEQFWNWLSLRDETAEPEWTSRRASYGAQRGKTLMFIHGYNVTEAEAFNYHNTLWRRLYWHGFRGNYWGLCWKGDQGRELMPLPLPLAFAPNVYEQAFWEDWQRFTTWRVRCVSFWGNCVNAMKTARRLSQIVEELPTWTRDGDSSGVVLMAHSLGNLVMWEALRQYAVRGNPQPAAGVTLSVEAAIWGEAFSQKPNEALVYPDGKDLAGIVYEPEELARHSWAYLFNADGMSKKSNKQYPVRETPVVKLAVNCYTPCDEALKVMKWSDWFGKSWDWFKRTSNGLHFDRELIKWEPGMTREPERLANVLPALLKRNGRHPGKTVRMQVNRRTMTRTVRGYGWTDLEDPVGMGESPFFDANINGQKFGWAAVNCDDCHSDFLERELTVMHPWFEAIAKYYVEE